MRINKTVRDESKTVNNEGGVAYCLPAEQELYQRCATCLVEDKYYEDASTSLKEIKKLVKAIAPKNPEYILQLASYCRKELNLRTIPVILLVEAANIEACTPFVRKWAPDIIMRADELTEATAYQLKKHKGKKSFPRCLRKGIADSLKKFNEYALGKYKKDSSEVKLKDVLKIVHPVPDGDAQRKLWGKIINETLEVPFTWETAISSEGSTKEAWEKVIPEMGIFAITRNLRNMLDKKCNMQIPLSKLTDETIIKKSRMFPFRFYQAYDMLQNNSNPFASEVLDALSVAMEYSAKNIEEFKGQTFISTDLSGSMTSTLSGKSNMSYREVGCILSALAKQFCERSIISVFADSFAIANLSSRTSAIENAKKLINISVGGSTNGYLTIKYLLDNQISVDRIMIFTDCEMYDSNDWGRGNETLAKYLKAYKKQVNPDVYMYLINLAGYGTTQIPTGESNTCLISGWSESVFKYMSLFEQDQTKIIKSIKGMIPNVKKIKNSEEISADM